MTDSLSSITTKDSLPFEIDRIESGRISKEIGYPPMSSNSLSNILNISELGWWMTTNTSFPVSANCLSKIHYISASLDDKPDVGSSTNKFPGSQNQFESNVRNVCADLHERLFSGFPTFSLISSLSESRCVQYLLTYLLDQKITIKQVCVT